jgi:hypothetical protein
MRFGASSLIMLLLVMTPSVSVRAATPAEVEAAIHRAIRAVYAAQRGGIWDPPMPMGANARKDLQWGGETALATYALLAAGESRQDAKLAKPIEFLKSAKIEGIYALGLRAQLWHYLQQTPEVKAGIKRDGELLVESIKSGRENKGMFNYPVKDKLPRYDNSVSQYGVLGLWAVAQLGYEVPTSSWKTIDGAWREHQLGDGGWPYTPRLGEATMSMTAAGIATLFITQDFLNLGKGADCTGNIRDANIDKAMKRITENFNNTPARRNYYTLYGLERIGVASGYKYFGTTDWYQDGAEFLVRNQEPSGRWGRDLSDTCFAILFLVRGRAPVIMNKLEYEIEQNGDKPKLANWNQRPRDAANLAHWVGNELERDINWQIVNLKVSVDDLHDSPILYIAGNQVLNFGAKGEKKLKQFVEQGGLIVGNADCGSVGFAQSFEKLGQRLFPPYEFRNLPRDHLIFTTPYNHTKWKVTPIIRGLSNGSREFMILMPTADYSKLWQLNIYHGREEGHQLMWNLYFYAIDKKNMRYKGDTYIVHESSQIKTARKIELARLEYAGNWNPEPGSWRRLHNVMHNSDRIDLDVKSIRLGSGELLKGGFEVAHLTGTHRVQLDPSAAAEISKFVEGGGTLIIDACGGNSEFALSVEEQLKSIFPEGKLTLLPPESPAYSSGVKAGDVSYRPFAKKIVGNLHVPRIKALEIKKRPAVFFSAEDLSTGLVGQSIDGIFGYEPQSATDLMRSILTFATGGPVAKPAPPAATTTPTKPSSDRPRRPGPRRRRIP